MASFLPVAAASVLLAAGCSGEQSSGGRPETSPSASGTGVGVRSSEVPLDATAPRSTRCPGVDPRWTVSRRLRRFFPASRAALWLRRDRCVHLVRATGDEAHAVWRARARERVHGLGWAPGGKAFAVTTESRVVLLERDGSLLRRVPATGAAFLHDGRLVVSRASGIYLLTESRSRRLASRQALERAARFPARRTMSVSHDPRGFTRGHGRGAVAITLWSAGRSWKSVVLVVSAAGRVVRASPAFRAGGGEGVVSGWTWSPDGRELFVATEVPGPHERSRLGEHDHCLDVWSAEHGRRRAFCESQLPPAHHSHFAKLAWASDGKTALLDTGTIVTRGGRVAGHTRVAGGDLAFQVQWEPTDDERER